MEAGETWLNAFLGAVVSVVLSFVPLSPVLGGGVAAYLQEGDRRECTRVGALSGLLAGILLALLFAVLVLVFFVLAPMNELRLFAGLLLVMGVIVVAYGVLLGALGGFAVAYLREEGHL